MTGTGPADLAAAPNESENVPPRLANLIAGTLRIGVGLSALLALVGIIRFLMGTPAVFAAATAHGASFTGHGFVSGLLHGQAADILLLSALVLILTPIVRVIISMALFASVRDRPFTLLTLTVLLLLATHLAH